MCDVSFLQEHHRKITTTHNGVAARMLTQSVAKKSYTCRFVDTKGLFTSYFAHTLNHDKSTHSRTTVVEFHHNKTAPMICTLCYHRAYYDQLYRLDGRTRRFHQLIPATRAAAAGILFIHSFRGASRITRLFCVIERGATSFHGVISSRIVSHIISTLRSH